MRVNYKYIILAIIVIIFIVILPFIDHWGRYVGDIVTGGNGDIIALSGGVATFIFAMAILTCVFICNINRWCKATLWGVAFMYIFAYAISYACRGVIVRSGDWGHIVYDGSYWSKGVACSIVCTAILMLVYSYNLVFTGGDKDAVT